MSVTAIVTVKIKLSANDPEFVQYVLDNMDYSFSYPDDPNVVLDTEIIDTEIKK